MIIPKSYLRKLLFVGNDGFTGVNIPSFFNIKFTGILYDRSTGLFKGKPVDDFIIKYLEKHKIDVILTVPQPNVEQACNFKWIKLALDKKIPIGFIWYDAISYPQFVKKLNCFHIILDNPSDFKGENIIPIWSPYVPPYHSPEKNRIIDVSFIGNIDCNQRRTAIHYLLNNGIHVFTAGNQFWNRLNNEMMYHYMRSSKISLNFSQNRFNKIPQFKGRVLEAMCSGSLVIEDDNPCTKPFFTDNEILRYNNHQDLYKKIKKYLENNEERIKIASNGQKACMEKYTHANWWKVILVKTLFLNGSNIN